jgi:hypothetical protein
MGFRLPPLRVHLSEEPEILADCTEEEKVKIAGANCARVYHLD